MYNYSTIILRFKNITNIVNSYKTIINLYLLGIYIIICTHYPTVFISLYFFLENTTSIFNKHKIILPCIHIMIISTDL